MPTSQPTPAENRGATPQEPVDLRVVDPSGDHSVPESVGSVHAQQLAHLPPIISSKIDPPPLRATTLTRHRLLERLPLTDPKKVTLIVADPRFGKTTLLADFSSRYPGRCIWYRLDESDRDWVTLVNYVIAAIRKSHSSFGEKTSTLLVPITGASPSKRAVIESLLHEMGDLGDQPTAMVFDDLQEIEESAEASEFLGRLLRDAPPSFVFVLSGRRRPTVPLARLASHGDLSELTTEDLRFSATETSRLFSEAYGQPLEPELLAELEKRTKGWAASLQLFYSLIKGRSQSRIRAAIRSLSGATSPIYDFLAEEVLNQMPPQLNEFSLRAAALDCLAPQFVAATFEPGTVSPADANLLLEEAERAGIVSRTGRGSTVRQFHPLLREFLAQKLAERHAAFEIEAIHHRVAVAAEAEDLLAATHHFIEAGEPREAMRCLDESVIQTIGSGRWGEASLLIDRLALTQSEPAVMVIRARRLLDDGEVTAASSLLSQVDVASLRPSVRAVLRTTKLALGWRRGDTDSLFRTLREITDDSETPDALRDIARVFVDASPMSSPRASLPSLARRLQGMARQQRSAGHGYYATISLHNAAIATLNSGAFTDALALGYEALAEYDRLSFPAAERYSTHAVLATALFEVGREHEAETHIELGATQADAHGDVHAECAYISVVTGRNARALHLLERAEALDRVGRLDMEGKFAGCAREGPPDDAQAPWGRCPTACDTAERNAA